MNSIEVINLTKKFGDFISVNNVSFTVQKGEIFGFLGANGAGKSTTIRMLCGIIEPTEGDALVAGYSIKKQSDLVKLNIGYMSQKFSLYDDLTVGENISFFGGIYGMDSGLVTERKKWVLNISNLEGKENILTGSLPGGIKQRLALGTAVIHKPGIVFLDEPTSGVDPLERRNFWELINQLSDEGITVFVTTHYLEEAEFCNNIILIDAGKIIAEGKPKELKSNYLKHQILEIEVDKPAEAMAFLEKQIFTDDVSLFGTKLHLMTNHNYINPEQIRSTVAGTDLFEIKLISKITPTLEDVFINLVGKN